MAFCSSLLFIPSGEMSGILQQRNGLVQSTRVARAVPSSSSVDGMGLRFPGRRRSTFFNDLSDTRKYIHIHLRLY